MRTEHHLGFLSLKGGCTGSSESTHVKMPQCLKPHALAQNCIIYQRWKNKNSSECDRMVGNEPQPHTSWEHTKREFHEENKDFKRKTRLQWPTLNGIGKYNIEGTNIRTLSYFENIGTSHFSGNNETNPTLGDLR